MELLHTFGWLVFWICTPVVAVGIALYFGEIKQKLIIGSILLIAAAMSLALLSRAMVHEYGPWPWFPVSMGLLHLAAGMAFAVSLGGILVLSKGRRKSKIVLAATSVLGWTIWWFVTTLLTACAMGDCL